MKTTTITKAKIAKLGHVLNKGDKWFTKWTETDSLGNKEIITYSASTKKACMWYNADNCGLFDIWKIED